MKIGLIEILAGAATAAYMFASHASDGHLPEPPPLFQGKIGSGQTGVYLDLAIYSVAAAFIAHKLFRR